MSYGRPDMSRDRELAPSRRHEEAPPRPDRRADDAVLALQQAVGNRAVTRMLARKGTPAKKKNPTVQIGKTSIEVSGGNIAAWTSGDAPDALSVESQKGRHSAELERLSKDRTRIDSLTLTIPTGGSEGGALDLGSVVIEIAHGRVKGYALDGTTESWQIGDFDGVHRTKTTHKVS
jgi:hypothetical protein